MPTAWFNDQFHDFESAFQSQLEAIHAPNRLKEAILYSTLNGGKRLRALLTLASGELCGADRETLYPIAGAIECIHAYSLIHDDLPAMDDDDFRRGKPTCHKAFDEATAILAGDALLTLSFELLSQVPNLSAEKKLEIIQLYSFSAGTQGMVGGQFIDLESEDKTITLRELETIHRKKTGALIKAAILAGAIAGNTNQDTYDKLAVYADNIGLAFQIKDDILDVTGTQEELGKMPGSDLLQDKSTYISLLGLESSVEKLNGLTDVAIDLLAPFGEKAEPLIELAHYIQKRNH